MSTMLVETYALKEAGASEEKARAAAASLTGRDERRFDAVDRRLQRVEQRLNNVERGLGLIEQGLEALTKRVAALEVKVIALAQAAAVIRAELDLMKWMHGIAIGGVLALFGQDVLRVTPRCSPHT